MTKKNIFLSFVNHNEFVMKFFILLILLAGSIVWAIYEYNNPPSERTGYYESGLSSYDSGNYEDAEYYFNEAVNDDPQDATSLFYRGLAKLKQEKFSSAIRDCKTASDMDFTLMTKYYEFGLDKYEIYLTDSLTEGTGDVEESALEVPEEPSTDSYNDLGLAEYKAGNYEKAIKYFNKALEYDGTYKFAIYNIGLCYYYQEKFDEAIEQYSKTIEIDPLYEDAFFNRAFIEYDQGNYILALADYNSFIKLNPNDASAFRNRGLTKQKLSDIDGACKDWEKAEKLGGNVSDLRPGYCK